MKGKKLLYKLVNPGLDEYSVHLNEAVFHNANGYIGIRYDFEENYPQKINVTRSQYINGVYDYADMPQAEKLYGLADEKQCMLSVANTQGINLKIDGEVFSMYKGKVNNWSLAIDMERGVTVRDVKWTSPKGKSLLLKVTRMASFHLLPLFLIEYEIEPLNFDGEIIIESVHDGEAVNFADPKDPRNAHTRTQHIIPTSIDIRNGVSYINSRTTKSGLKICSAVKNVLAQDCEEESRRDGNRVISTIRTEAKRKEVIKLDKYAVFCDSLRYNDTEAQAREEMCRALAMSTEELFMKQEEHLSEYWENCYVEISDEEELSEAMFFNMYHLNQSASRDSFGNIAPKGLSGEGYEGHYFWDTEMFMLPFFTITNPSISKVLLESRYRQLENARKNARRMGHRKGALYPWRTITGKECSGFFPSGSAQYHINGDIAYAIIAYYMSTGDLDFIVDKGAEIIFETARLWLDAGNFCKDKFYINDVTGPDEYTCIVNNNYYTNALAQYHLRWAVKFFEMLNEKDLMGELEDKIKLKKREISLFAKAADAMYLPYDEELGINPQDDSFLNKKKWDLNTIPKNKFPLLLHYHPLYLYRHQICKQADTIMSYLILEDTQSRETMINSFRYYEKITTHDSSLSKSVFSMMAARLGMEEKAYKYFGDTAKLDLLDLYHNTDDGIHTSNMAGSFLTIVYGFGGFRLKEDGISFDPILPKKWKKYRFFVYYKGSRIMVQVSLKDCEFTLTKGDAKEITVYGNRYTLEDELKIRRPKDLYMSAREDEENEIQSSHI